LYPHQLIWSIPANDQKIYLTFDDGPTPGVTDRLLDLLKVHDVKATFFCIGKNVAENPELFLRILKEGHMVGNHTWDHSNSKYAKKGDFLSSIKKTEKLIHSKLFRPPYGRLSFKHAREVSKDYKIIMWSVLTGDFDAKITKEQCLDIALNYTKTGSIIVFHDSIKASEKMLYAVPLFIESCRKRGFKFSGIRTEIL